MTRKKPELAPHDLEAEQAIIGSMLVFPEKSVPAAMSVLRSGEFYRDVHGIIFAAIAAIAMRGGAVDLLTVRSALKEAGKLESVGGAAYLSSITDGIPNSSNVRHYADIVRDHASRRAIIDACERIRTRAFEFGDPAKLVDEAVATLLAVVKSVAGDATVVGDGVRLYVESLIKGEVVQPIPTGFADLDGLIGGFRPLDLVYVAGRPSHGKTSMTLGAALNMAHSGVGVEYFSLEVPKQRLFAKVVSWESGASVSDLETGRATPEEYALAIEAEAKLASVPLVFEDSARTLSQIYARVRRLQSERPIGVVFIDYLGLMLSDDRRDSRQEEVAALSRSLKQAGRDLGVTMAVLSQLSRDPEGRKDKRPQLSDLRESGSLEQDADLVLLLHRPAMHSSKPEDQGVAELIVAKNREGATGSVRLAFVEKLARFGNLSRESE